MHIFSCVHHNSLTSNANLTAVEVQLFLMLDRFPVKPSGFFVGCRNIS